MLRQVERRKTAFEGSAIEKMFVTSAINSGICCVIINLLSFNRPLPVYFTLAVLPEEIY
ncbi:MAG TPA: hypothetical protein VHK67_00780 [Rhabdochlamydiaceae bacterium]|jgi:hypothetical protein|nr:hypothetical protein [Rhabdochlamydiaceae bacterium]